MNQVSRPMQIALAFAVVVALLWFVLLKPKNDSAEPVAATPAAAPVATPRPVDAGGAKAQTGLGKAVESANNAAATSNSTTKAQEQETGEQTSSATAAAPAATPAAAAAAAAATAAPAGTTPSAATATKAAKKGSTRSRAQRHADHVIEGISKNLQRGHVVVVLVSSPTGSEDKIVRKRISKEIDRRRGRVNVVFVPTSQVGLYDGLLSSLNLGQTPSTIVIAPDNTAKVLGGLVSTARLDRLTSAALLIKPVKAAK